MATAARMTPLRTFERENDEDMPEMEKKMKMTTACATARSELVWNHSHQRQNAAPPPPAMSAPNHSGPKYIPRSMVRWSRIMRTMHAPRRKSISQMRVRGRGGTRVTRTSRVLMEGVSVIVCSFSIPFSRTRARRRAPRKGRICWRIRRLLCRVLCCGRSWALRECGGSSVCRRIR